MKSHITCLIFLLIKLTRTTVTAVHCDGEYVPSYFESATKSGHFVDKTMLLKTFLNNTSKVLITCPKGFGKTVNIDMTKRFFQLTVNGKTGKKIDKKISRNYKLFTDRKLNFQIAQDTDFVEHHLGEYIVVHLSFTHIQGTSSEQIRDSIREKIRMLLTSYHWLYKLMEVKYQHEEFGTRKYDLEKYRKILNHQGNELDSIQGLKILLRYLRDTYENQLIAFIDDYDLPIRHAIKHGIDAEEINKFVISIIGLFVSITRYADYTMITGVLRLFKDDQCADRIEDLHYHQFTDNHTFAEYFGFTENEVHRLLVAKNILDDKRTNLKKYFNGYRIPNTTIPLYNPKGIKQYLDTNTIYRTVDDIIPKIFKCLRHPAFFEQLCKIYTYEKIPISINFYANQQDLTSIIRTVQNNCSNYSESGQCFAPFVDLGYLTYTDDRHHLQLPNTMAEEKLKQEFHNYFLETYGINVTNPEITTSLKLIFSIRRINVDYFNKFAKFLQQLFQQVDFSSLDEFQFQSIIFAAIYSNIHTVADAKLRITGSIAENRFDHIDKLKISSEDQKVLVIFKVTFKRTLQDAIQEAGAYVPFDSITASSLKIIKYVGINMNEQNQVEVGRR